MTVSIKPSGSSLNAAAPVLLFAKPNFAPSASIFSVTTDGRFLLQLRPAVAAGLTQATATAASPAAAAPVTIIVNWAASRGR